MKYIFFILLFLPILCNELVFEVFEDVCIESNFIDKTSEDSSEKENSDNSEEETKIEYFNHLDKIFRNITDQKEQTNYSFLQNWSLHVIDVHSPPPEVTNG